MCSQRTVSLAVRILVFVHMSHIENYLSSLPGNSKCYLPKLWNSYFNTEIEPGLLMCHFQLII